MYVLRLQTSIVCFLSLFSEELMCMRQNFKLFCCAAYILNLIVSICLPCWPNLWCSGVFSAEFRSFRKNSAKPDISRKYGSAGQIVFEKSGWGVYSQAYVEWVFSVSWHPESATDEPTICNCDRSLKLTRSSKTNLNSELSEDMTVL